VVRRPPLAMSNPWWGRTDPTGRGARRRLAVGHLPHHGAECKGTGRRRVVMLGRPCKLRVAISVLGPASRPHGYHGGLVNRLAVSLWMPLTVASPPIERVATPDLGLLHGLSPFSSAIEGQVALGLVTPPEQKLGNCSRRRAEARPGRVARGRPHRQPKAKCTQQPTQTVWPPNNIDRSEPLGTQVARDRLRRWARVLGDAPPSPAWRARRTGPMHTAWYQPWPEGRRRSTPGTADPDRLRFLLRGAA
jgi:hypothetical protein